MVELLSTGRTRYIGVSNFSPSQILAILPIAKPYAHQYETHPYLPQTDFLAFHKTHGIHVTAYSPLGNQNPIYTSWRKDFYAEHLPTLLENPVVTEVAEKRGCTPAQVVLKWGMLRGTSVIPKSKHADRIAENWKSVGCEIQPADRAMLISMARKRFNNPSNSWGVRLYQGLQDSTGLMGAVLDIITGWKDKALSSVESIWKRYGSRDTEEL